MIEVLFFEDSKRYYFGTILTQLAPLLAVSPAVNSLFTDDDQQSACRLNVHVADGGSPALSDSASVIIELEDTNDNVPIFALCNMTAIVQVPFYYIYMRLWGKGGASDWYLVSCILLRTQSF
ncbi:hypothetical protein Tcan_00098 [Toxocara canis]|uniref:Cadherin domain-containing protein n=1 Tax=Toxocara canis TaxID=6265 RepID=A0A0B2UWB8_TOXCA|nr:hypothetical protein Tcan_00098 [Toxocara canis]